MAKILVIDDDPAVLPTVELVLKRDGHEVITTGNAYAGLAQLDKTAFDLAIVDLCMPEMDGLETINQIDLKYPQLHILVLSGYAFEETVAQRPDFLVMETGEFVSLRKPFRAADLRNAVGQCLGPTPATASAVGGSASR